MLTSSSSFIFLRCFKQTGTNTHVAIRATIGQTDFTSTRQNVNNKTKFELQNVNLVGGSSIGQPVRIPCIMDKVCPGTLTSVDETTAFTFYIEYLLSLEGLPAHLVVDVDGIALSLDDNTHTEFIRLSLPGTFHFDSRVSSSSSTPLGLTAQLFIDSGTRARDVIRSIGGIDYRLHLYGNGGTSGGNALASLWQPSDAYLIEIGSETSDPNSEDNVPEWYFPLKSTNTWTLVSTTASTAVFNINNFPVNWPLTFPLHLVDPQIDVVYQTSGKSAVTIARATLKPQGSDAIADLNLIANTTDQRHWIKLMTLSDSTNGPSYCRAGRTYVDNNKCATGEVVYHVLADHGSMGLRLNLQYTLPHTLGNNVGGTLVTGSFDMSLFDNYWSDEWSRVQQAFTDNEWAIIPPGPPRGPAVFEFSVSWRFIVLLLLLLLFVVCCLLFVVVVVALLAHNFLKYFF